MSGAICLARAGIVFYFSRPFLNHRRRRPVDQSKGIGVQSNRGRRVDVFRSPSMGPQIVCEYCRIEMFLIIESITVDTGRPRLLIFFASGSEHFPDKLRCE